MSAPTNISFATATDLGTITTTTQTFTQQIDDAGVNKTTYYTFVAPTGSVVVGAFGRVDVTLTLIQTNVYLGPATSPTQLMLGGGPALSATDKPMQFPVTALSTYFLECIPSAFVSSPTTLLIDVTVAPHGAIPVGSFAVNDDTDGGTPGFPLALLSGTATAAVVGFVSPFPFGEAGDTLVNGTVCVEDFANTGIKVFNGNYQTIATVPVTNSHNCRIRTCLGLNVFYLATNENPTKLYSVTSGGVLSSAEVLTAMTSCAAVAVNNLGTIAYHAFTGTNTAIRQWTLGGAAAANLAAGIVGYAVVDILCPTGTDVLVGYYKSSVTRDYKVLRYSAAGATLSTYTFAEPSSVAAPRLAYAIDDPNSFWVMTHPVSTTGLTTFLNIKISDGSTLHTVNQRIFETGVSTSAASLTPPATFGASFSCPFWVVRSATVTTQTFTIRRQRRWLLPQSESNKRMTIPVMRLLMRTGIGLLPDAAGSSTPLGVDPEVRLRISKDGGKTWGPERSRSAGLRGEYRDRVRWTRATGNYRNGVGEVTVDAPVDWQWLAMLGEPVEGSS